MTYFCRLSLNTVSHSSVPKRDQFDRARHAEWYGRQTAGETLGDVQQRCNREPLLVKNRNVNPQEKTPRVLVVHCFYYYYYYAPDPIGRRH